MPKRREKPLRLVINDEEQQHVKRQAAKLGLSVAAWVRMTIRRAVGLTGEAA